MLLEYSVYVSTFHATRISISNCKMPCLSTFFDSKTKDKDKLIQMGALRIPNWNFHAIKVQGSNNYKSKKKQIMKQRNPK